MTCIKSRTTNLKSRTDGREVSLTREKHLCMIHEMYKI